MTKSVYFSNQVLYPVDFLDPVALFPLNAQNGTKEINNRVVQGLPGEVRLAPGPDGAAGGSFKFLGNSTSYIEFPNSAGGPMDVHLFLYYLSIYGWKSWYVSVCVCVGSG